MANKNPLNPERLNVEINREEESFIQKRDRNICRPSIFQALTFTHFSIERSDGMKIRCKRGNNCSGVSFCDRQIRKFANSVDYVFLRICLANEYARKE